MVHRLFISLASVCIFGCSQMDEIATEFDRIEEACEVLQKADDYQKYGIDRQQYIIVKYSSNQSIKKRLYLGICGPELSAPSGETPLLYSALYRNQPPAWNPLEEWRPVPTIVLFKFSKDEARIPFNSICDAAIPGSSALGHMKSRDKFFVISQENDGFRCQIESDPTTRANS